METFEHTKCKPIAIALAVVRDTRQIIAVEVASMPAKGKLAPIARKKYGPRHDHRRRALNSMASAIKQSKGLGMTPDQTAKRSAAVTNCRHWPELMLLLEQGQISLTTINLVGPKLTPANKEILLNGIIGKSTREVRQLLAEVDAAGNRRQQQNRTSHGHHMSLPPQISMTQNTSHGNCEGQQRNFHVQAPRA